MTPPQTLSFTVTVGRDDLVAWSEWSYRHQESRTTRWMTGYVLPACLLATAIIPPYTVAKFVVVLAGILVLGLARLRDNYRIRARYAKTIAEPEYAAYHGEKRYVVDGSSISVEDETGVLRAEWSYIEDVAITQDHVFVMFATSAFILRRDQLSPDIEQAVIERGASLPVGETIALSEEDRAAVAQATFVAEAKDAEAVVQRHLRVSKRQGVTWFVAGSAMGGGSAILPWIDMNSDPLAMVCTAVICGVVCFGVGFTMRWEALRRYGRQMGTGGETQVMLSPAAIRVNTSTTSELLEWSWVSAVEVKPNGLLLRMGVLGVFVPKRAFGTEAEFQDFALVALKLHDQHRPAA